MVEWARNKDRNNKIKQMRREGCSIPEISKALSCSKSTVSLHCKGIQAPRHKITAREKKARCKSARTSQDMWNKRIEQAIQDAQNQWPEHKRDPKFLAAIALYWGEGCKKSPARTRSVGFANSDPQMISFMKKFFDKMWLPDNYLSYAYYYQDMDINAIKTKWTEATGLDVTLKLRKSNKKKGESTCYLYFCNYIAYHSIMTWIKCWKDEIATIVQW